MAQWYYGNASYYSGCTPGPSQPCCKGNYHDTAYGYYWTDQSCGVVPKMPCGTAILVWDRCKNKKFWTYIRTQCSCKSELGSCYGRTRCNSNLEGGYSTPILDLTRDLFLLLHGSLTDGRIRVGVYV